MPLPCCHAISCLFTDDDIIITLSSSITDILPRFLRHSRFSRRYFRREIRERAVMRKSAIIIDACYAFQRQMPLRYMLTLCFMVRTQYYNTTDTDAAADTPITPAFDSMLRQIFAPSPRLF